MRIAVDANKINVHVWRGMRTYEEALGEARKIARELRRDIIVYRWRRYPLGYGWSFTRGWNRGTVKLAAPVHKIWWDSYACDITE